MCVSARVSLDWAAPIPQSHKKSVDRDRSRALDRNRQQDKRPENNLIWPRIEGARVEQASGRHQSARRQRCNPDMHDQQRR